MTVLENVSLKEFNTFGVDAKASLFASVKNQLELQEVLKDPRFKNPFLIGGGSNLLFVNSISRPVIHINIGGIKIIDENDDSVIVSAGAGIKWHDLVLWALKNNYGGIENLALIPGNTGTAPIQNIGAYGVELKDVFYNLIAVSIDDCSTHIFDENDCEFGYRDSKFKNEWSHQYVITSVRLMLQKNNHFINTQYGAIEKTLIKKNISNPSIQDVADAVIEIRNNKLPNPKELGNSGSFLKNPIVSKEKTDKLLLEHPNLPHYEFTGNFYKISAGWLIEKSGLKGLREGNVGMHAQQALVLVNYGNATGKELWKFAQKVQQTVAQKFGITLDPEVNIIE
ncbi:MAG: UDP-N-acetylmuramate dehydrogenase [Flavobacteriaceae bacterium]|nr:UDP-N-acetylmuramate dehydrogenase [Flavobacteriaceae bacterium]